MIWIARSNTGAVRKQWENGTKISTNDISKKDIEEFTVMETSEKHSVAFNSVTGFIDFRNLDYSRLQGSESIPDMVLKFDPSTSEFRMAPESLVEFQKYMAEDPAQFFKVSRFADGKIDVNGIDPDFELYDENNESIQLRGGEHTFYYQVTAESIWGLKPSGATVPFTSRDLRFVLTDIRDIGEFHATRKITMCYETRRVTIELGLISKDKERMITFVNKSGSNVRKDRHRFRKGAMVTLTKVISLL